MTQSCCLHLYFQYYQWLWLLMPWQNRKNVKKRGNRKIYENKLVMRFYSETWSMRGDAHKGTLSPFWWVTKKSGFFDQIWDCILILIKSGWSSWIFLDFFMFSRRVVPYFFSGSEQMGWAFPIPEPKRSDFFRIW